MARRATRWAASRDIRGRIRDNSGPARPEQGGAVSRSLPLMLP